MKLRHVRAVAVFGIAVFALTGARGSHGGSCSGSSSSGSHGSSNSNSNDSTTGGTTGSVSGGSSSARKAERDVRIDDCLISADKLTVKLTLTNSDAMAYKYDVSVQFKGEAGGPSADVAFAKVDDLLVPANGSQSTEASTPYTGKGDGSEYKKCLVVSASRVVSG